MPCVSAIAVTPTVMDMSGANEPRELLIINNVNDDVSYNISSDHNVMIEPNSFSLKKEESRIVKVSVKSFPHNSSLHVEEMRDGYTIINSVRIPVISSREDNHVYSIKPAQKAINPPQGKGGALKAMTGMATIKDKAKENYDLYIIGALIFAVLVYNLMRLRPKRMGIKNNDPKE
ncbi:MAG: hypothetical protein V1906_03160 [Candidatus Woesearchaeota archaeon]